MWYLIETRQNKNYFWQKMNPLESSNGEKNKKLWHLTNIFTLGWVTAGYGVCCPDLSPPKPLDQSKNVTVRTYHNLWEEKKGEKNWPKSAKSAKKSQNLFSGLVRPCLPKAGTLVSYIRIPKIQKSAKKFHWKVGATYILATQNLGELKR